MRFCIYQHRLVPTDLVFDSELIAHGDKVWRNDEYQPVAVCETLPCESVTFERLDQPESAGGAAWFCRIRVKGRNYDLMFDARDVWAGRAFRHIRMLWADLRRPPIG